MPKNLYRRGKVWHFEKAYKGTKFRGSLETTSLREAQARLEIKMRELIATQWGEKPRRSFDEAAIKFQEEHLPRLRPSTEQRYIVSLGLLADTFEGIPLHEISRSKLYEFEQSRYRAGRSNPTIRRDLACLSSLMSFCIALEWIEVNPVPAYLKARSKAGLKENAPRTRYLSHDEERRLLAAAANELREIIAFKIDTGLRKNELFYLQRHHIDLEKREVIVDATVAKNGKERRVPLLPRALEIARRRVLQRRSPYLFPTKGGNRYTPRSGYVLSWMRKAAKRAGIIDHADLHLHDLRRTCGCRLLQDYDMGMERVCRWLGHSSVVVTERHYAFLRDEDLHKGVRPKGADVVKLKGE